MKMLSSSADAVEEPKRDAQPSKDNYRAPQLVTLGTTIRLVQGGAGFQRWDGGRGYYS
jgi:hypothetical protein